MNSDDIDKRLKETLRRAEELKFQSESTHTNLSNAIAESNQMSHMIARYKRLDGIRETSETARLLTFLLDSEHINPSIKGKLNSTLLMIAELAMSRAEKLVAALSEGEEEENEFEVVDDLIDET